MTIRGNLHAFDQFWVGGASTFSGVYVLWDDGELIYIGGTDEDGGVRARLTDHLYGGDPCLRHATHFQYEVTAMPWTRERELILEFQAENNRLPKCNDTVPSGLPYN